MNSKQIVAIVSAVALVVILVYPALATGSVTVKIGSSNIEKADHVYVTIANVWAHRSGSGWQLISNQSQNVDLVALENSSMDLGKANIPLGSYDMVRVEISNVTWVFNKTTTDLQLQSSQIQSNLDFSVKAGQGAVITLSLTGQEQVLQGTKFFTPTLTATVS